MQGVAAKQEQLGAIDSLMSGGGPLGALGMIKGKIDLPVVGKVTAGEALQLFQTLKGFMGGGGLQALTGSSGAANATGNTVLK
jgi:hypothetical protein